jgi:hypothetical protein
MTRRAPTARQVRAFVAAARANATVINGDIELKIRQGDSIN